MKKLLYAFFAIVLAVSFLGGCSDKSGINQTTAPSEASENNRQPENGSTDNPSHAFGQNVEVGYEIKKDKIKMTDVKDFDGCRIYKDNYPMGQGGPLFEVTDEVKAMINNEIDRFLRIAGLEINDDGKKSDLSVIEVTCKSGEYIIAAPQSMSADIKGSGLTVNSDIKEITSHPLIASLLDFIGFDSYDSDADCTLKDGKLNSVEYILTDSSTPATGKYVRISLSNEFDSVFAAAVYPDFSAPAVTERKFVSCESAKKSLEKENRTVDGVKIIYTLNNDLWIPYYKFYVRADLSAADGFTVYNTYTVPCFR